MPPPWIQSGGPSAGGCPGPGPLVLLPVVIYFVRSNGDLGMVTSLRSISTGSPEVIADSAHKIIQGMLAKLPDDMLYWFCSKVLNLSSEVSRNTVDFLKSQSTLGGWTSGSGLAGARLLDASAELNGATAGRDELEQRLERLETTLRLLETSGSRSGLVEYDGESARSLLLLNAPNDDLQDKSGNDIGKTLSTVVYDKNTEHNADQSTALTSSRPHLNSTSTPIAQELGLRKLSRTSFYSSYANPNDRAWSYSAGLGW